MSTFIQLVNDVERESGTVSQAQRLTTVTGARGRQEKIVQWTAQAWAEIQRERRDWTFMRKRFLHAVTSGVASYTAADLGITDFGGWMTEADHFQPFTIYETAKGRQDETRLRILPFNAWLTAYDVGAHDAQRPNYIAIGFDRSLNLGPTPDRAYTLRGWYRRSIQMLAADNDTPFIDEQFHNAIVWRALMLLGEHDEATFPIAAAQSKARVQHSAMLREFTPQVET